MSENDSGQSRLDSGLGTTRTLGGAAPRKIDLTRLEETFQGYRTETTRLDQQIKGLQARRSEAQRKAEELSEMLQAAELPLVEAQVANLVRNLPQFQVEHVLVYGTRYDGKWSLRLRWPEILVDEPDLDIVPDDAFVHMHQRVWALVGNQVLADLAAYGPGESVGTTLTLLRWTRPRPPVENEFSYPLLAKQIFDPVTNTASVPCLALSRTQFERVVTQTVKRHAHPAYRART